METMQDGVLIVDHKGTVIDKNAYINQFFEEEEIVNARLVGSHINQLLFRWPQWHEACHRMEQVKIEIETEVSGLKRIYIVLKYSQYHAKSAVRPIIARD